MFNIAIDGPSASGKSSIAKQLAQKLGFVHIDTGAMYRALGLMCLNEDIDMGSEELCYETLKKMDIKLDEQNRVFINGEDVSEAIRQNTVSEAASKVSQHQKVRHLMVEMQRNMAKEKGFVMDGRDITSVVLPDAEIKIFQTADPKIRAERRYLELQKRGSNPDFEAIYEDLLKRDHRDQTRENSPLIKVEDAIEIDTSHMSIEEVVSKIMEMIDRKGLR